MSIDQILKPKTTAWLLGGVLVAGLSAFAYSLVGWIGIGTIGLFGLLISTTMALNSGRTAVESGFDASMYVRQVEEERKSQSSPEQKMAADAERRKRALAALPDQFNLHRNDRVGLLDVHAARSLRVLVHYCHRT